jgi:hypothetical protein
MRILPMDSKLAIAATINGLIVSGRSVPPTPTAEASLKRAVNMCSAKHRWSQQKAFAEGYYTAALLTHQRSLVLARERGINADGLAAAATQMSMADKLVILRAQPNGLVRRKIMTLIRKFDVRADPASSNRAAASFMIAGILVVSSVIRLDSARDAFAAS